MGEIKQYTGIEKNGIITYRLNSNQNEKNLEKQGLVETRKIDSVKGSLGVTVATLTDKGREVVDRVMNEDTGPSLSEEVQMLRSVVEDLSDRVDDFEGYVDAVHEDLSRVNKRFGSSQELEELKQQAENVIEKHEEEIERNRELHERNRELRRRLHKMKEIERLMKSLGLVKNDAIGGWDNSEEGGFVEGPMLLKLDRLDRAGVLDKLGEKLTDQEIPEWTRNHVAVEVEENQYTPPSELEEPEEPSYSGTEESDQAEEVEEIGTEPYDPTEEFDQAEEEETEAETDPLQKRPSQRQKIVRLLEADRWKRRVRGLETTEEVRELLEAEAIRPSEGDLERLAEEYDLEHTG